VRLLVIRHGIAEDREEAARAGRPDEERTLTEEGRSRMAGAAAGVRTIVPTIDRLAASPLVRAVETAQVVAEEYSGLAVDEVECLAPGAGAEAVVAWLGECGEQETIAVVGHEPDLSELVTYLLSGATASAVEMKKGAVALVESAGRLQPGSGTLRWLLAPKHLRIIGSANA
jgi:phosphohistidine phosphatase